MRVFTGGMIVVLAAVTLSAADISTREAKRIEEAATVLKEIHAVPDKDIPLDLGRRPRASSSCRGSRRRRSSSAASTAKG